MAVDSPVSPRFTVAALLLLTFATGLVDAISVLVLGHVFVANMTGNVIFLGFWFVPHSGVDLTAAVVAFVSFLFGTVLGGRFARHLDYEVRVWLTAALGTEVVLMTALAVAAGTGVLDYHDTRKLILIGGLAVVFGAQNAAARQFGIQELSTTVLTSTIVGIGVDSRLAGGTGQREKLRFGVVLTMCAGAVVGATMSRFTVAPVIGQAGHLVVVGDVQQDGRDPGQPIELPRVTRGAHGGDDVPAALGQVRHDGSADSARGAGDQHCGHVRLPSSRPVRTAPGGVRGGRWPDWRRW